MSNEEINQIELFEKLVRKEIKQKQAGQLLGLSVRQVKRKLHSFRLNGARSLIHQGRGKSSNNKIQQSVADQAIKLIKDYYWDFGPTFAHEKLVESHHCTLSVSKLRQEMINVGLWQAKSRRKLVTHQLRERRACFGELLQIDGSPHDWLEGRAPYCNLNVAVDDATGIPVMEFSKVETTQDYFSLIEGYIAQYGLPRAIYSDKHSIFRINKATSLNNKKPSPCDDANENLTQFGRAMSELGIALIQANSPQAKGRVEKLNGNLQNRLVKEMRIRSISSIDQANEFLPEFTHDYVEKFAIKPRSTVDMHRPLFKGMSLSKVLCTKEERILSKNLTCQYQDTIYQVITNRSPYALRHTSVSICERFDGALTILDNRGNKLDYTMFRKVRQNQVANTKEINQLVDAILVEQARVSYKKRNPWESDLASLEGQNLYYKPMRAI